MNHLELIPEVAKLFVEGGLASVQLICRRFYLSYPRAMEIMDALEEKKIVGPFEGNKTRNVLCTNIQELKILLKK